MTQLHRSFVPRLLLACVLGVAVAAAGCGGGSGAPGAGTIDTPGGQADTAPALSASPGSAAGAVPSPSAAVADAASGSGALPVPATPVAAVVPGAVTASPPPNATAPAPVAVPPQPAGATQVAASPVAAAVSIAASAAAVPSPLRADAGADALADQAVPIALDGRLLGAVTPATRPTYAWRQTAGPTVVLSGSSTARPSFMTPFVKATTVLTFALTVSVSGTAATDSVDVTVARDNPWGVAPSTALSYDPASWLPAMSEAGVTTVRGFYSTATIDKVPLITAAGMQPVGVLLWSSAPALSLPANDLPGWRDFVAREVTRSKGRVKHWEIWNEPPNFTADTSPVSYARVVAAAYEVIKSLDPTAQVGLAAKSNHVKWLAESIAAGAADKFDFITLHPYEVASMLPQGWEGQFMGIVPRVRKMLLDKNPKRANVPVWFTEIGTDALPVSTGGMGPQGQADVLTKIYAMGLAQGVARIYWFDPRDSEGLTMGLTAGNGSKRPSWFALRALSTHLGPRPDCAGWVQPGNAYHGFVFKGPQGVVLAAWARPGRSVALTTANDVSVVDPRTGNKQTTRAPVVTEAPVLLVASSGSQQAQRWLEEAAANAGKPFAWEGDHSAASSVSLTAGSPPAGLFLVNPPAVTTVNGTPEFNFEGRGGPSFAVDPEFLAYTTTPVRITVVLRKLGAASAGFNLKYESDAPLASVDGNGLTGASTGWFNLSGTQLYEKTWTLPNTQFNSLYGYNFRFDTDGPAHSNFSIHRVTVSR